MSKATVADTIADQSVQDPIPAQPIDPPTITVTFGINDSPLAGRDGKKVQSRVIRDRLLKECESNVAIKMVDTPVVKPLMFQVEVNCKWVFSLKT